MKPEDFVATAAEEKEIESILTAEKNLDGIIKKTMDNLVPLEMQPMLATLALKTFLFAKVYGASEKIAVMAVIDSVKKKWNELKPEYEKAQAETRAKLIERLQTYTQLMQRVGREDDAAAFAQIAEKLKAGADPNAPEIQEILARAKPVVKLG